MPRRRWLAVPLACGLAAALVAGPAQADPAPAPGSGLVAATDQLAAAQDAAEQAAEAYHGAQVSAGTAAQDAKAAADAAAQARTRADAAQEAADAARDRFDAAASSAAVREYRSEDLSASRRDAQQRLDAFAASAYRGGGAGPELAMITAVLRADPVGYAYSKTLVERANSYQRTLVRAATTAEHQATGDAAQAATDRAVAHDEARRVEALAQAASETAAVAQQQADAAAAAADAASRAEAAAAAAKAQMQSLVQVAEQQLAASRTDPNALQLQAVAARAQADALRGGGPVAAPTQAAGVAIAAAFREIGVPYSWGGGTASGPSLGFAQGAGTVGFDCSGLVLYAYAQAGIRLDHYTGSQWDVGTKVPIAQLAPGDLVFFASDTGSPATIHHVGLYVGGGQMIEAPHTGAVVRVASISRSGLMPLGVRVS